jgi:hypothetical protein
MQHINRLGTVSLTHSVQLRPLFVISGVIPHTPNRDDHGRTTILWFVVAWFFYVPQYVPQQTKNWCSQLTLLGNLHEALESGSYPLVES